MRLLHIWWGQFLEKAVARSPARFRISIKDQKFQITLKVELIETRGLWGERRFALRVNGCTPAHMSEGSLTEILHRIRRWLVRRAAR